MPQIKVAASELLIGDRLVDQAFDDLCVVTRVKVDALTTDVVFNEVLEQRYPNSLVLEVRREMMVPVRMRVRAEHLRVDDVLVNYGNQRVSSLAFTTDTVHIFRIDADGQPITSPRERFHNITRSVSETYARELENLVANAMTPVQRAVAETPEPTDIYKPGMNDDLIPKPAQLIPPGLYTVEMTGLDNQFRPILDMSTVKKLDPEFVSRRTVTQSIKTDLCAALRHMHAEDNAESVQKFQELMMGLTTASLEALCEHIMAIPSPGEPLNKPRRRTGNKNGSA